MKVCKDYFNHRGSLLELMPAYLSAVKVCKRHFHHRESLLNLVLAYLSYQVRFVNVLTTLDLF